ncbi:MAG TPA: WYL domain-containing transcriptional regulator [Rectinemataceae bacterium]|nr:WYL domain-containing transcriptional regulator [Rectinemataceae bacterium]
MYHSLIQILSAARLIGRLSGATIREIQENLGISRRTAYRVLEALDELQYPYYKDEEHGNRYRLVDPGRSASWWVPLPAISFDQEDRVLLNYLFESASRDPALVPAITRLRSKLSFAAAAAGFATAPKTSGAGPASKAPTILTSWAAGKAAKPEVEGYLSTLLLAAEKRRACEVSYESRESGTVKTYEINPLALFESEGGLYCYVEVPIHGSVVILALERIRELKLLDHTFKPLKDFDAEKRLADPFGIVQEEEAISVKLIFSEGQAPYVRDRAWPESYRFEELPDGRLDMSFETSGLFGLKRWILSWGSDIVVKAPEWLRDQLLLEINAIEGLYQNSHSD